MSASLDAYFRSRARAERALAQEQAVQREVDRAKGELALGLRPRVTSKVAKRLLLGGSWAHNGRILKVASVRSLGCGVHEVSL
jgi:hypothetical protein